MGNLMHLLGIDAATGRLNIPKRRQQSLAPAALIRFQQRE